jgi:hypothetical protein
MEDTWTPEGAIPEDIREYIQSVGENGSSFDRLHIFLQIIYRLKATKRTGWLNYGVQDAESISDHMYRMGIITMLTSDSSLNRDRCTKLALVHDMAEALVGDITPADPIPKGKIEIGVYKVLNPTDSRGQTQAGAGYYKVPSRFAQALQRTGCKRDIRVMERV